MSSKCRVCGINLKNNREGHEQVCVECSPKPVEVMSRENLQILFSDLADKHFPKGISEERGNLLVFIAEAIMALEGKTGKEKV